MSSKIFETLNLDKISNNDVESLNHKWLDFFIHCYKYQNHYKFL